MCIINRTPLDHYQELDSALPDIFVISYLLIAIAFVWVYYPIWPFNKLGFAWPFESEEFKRLLFIFYICVFGGTFITYFSSRWKAEDCRSKTLQKILQFFQVRTLRRLLVETSSQWKDLQDTQLDPLKLIEDNHRKSQSSMTALAIMVAASVLVLREVHNIVTTDWQKTDSWDHMIMISAATAGIIALICFFISVDALDALVNAFKKDEVKLKDYFYKKAINPRYFGFLLLILEVILITTYHNPIFACVLLGLFLTIGYSHLFPNVRNPRDSQLEAFVIGVVLILVPVGVELYL